MANGVWTNNWLGLKNAMLLGGNLIQSGLNTIYSLTGSAISINSSDSSGFVTVSPLSPLIPSYDGSTNSGFLALMVGSGTNLPTAQDYALGAPITSGIAVAAITQSDYNVNVAASTASRSYTFTVQNTGALPLTITEFGMVVRVVRDSTLIYHELLDSPVTLNQYESATLTVTVTMELNDPI